MFLPKLILRFETVFIFHGKLIYKLMVDVVAFIISSLLHRGFVMLIVEPLETRRMANEEECSAMMTKRDKVEILE